MYFVEERNTFSPSIEYVCVCVCVCVVCACVCMCFVCVCLKDVLNMAAM